MKKYLLFIVFSVFCLKAEEFTLLQSSHISYAEQLMVMEGNVCLKGKKGVIRADKAEIPLTQKEGTLYGNIEMICDGGEKLTCSYAEFDLDNQTIYFHDNVALTNQEGVLLCAKSMVVGFTPVKSSDSSELQQIETVKAVGDVELQRENEWVLKSDSALYDKKRHEIAFFADAKEDSSLFFSDGRGRIFAKTAIFDLSSQECMLIESVKMINRKGLLEQYAIADRVKMTKENNEIRFFSNSGGRVLFYDKVNRLQMSAPELFIVKDPLSKREIVKGLGNVRFYFKDEEYDRLRQYVILEKLDG